MNCKLLICKDLFVFASEVYLQNTIRNTKEVTHMLQVEIGVFGLGLSVGRCKFQFFIGDIYVCIPGIVEFAKNPIGTFWDFGKDATG